MNKFPSRIICLTEESVETLYLLGKEDNIVGVSEYVRRPSEAMNLPKVTQFIKADFGMIQALGPDLVLGFSDLQKDIASELIGRGLNVFITNQRSLDEILSYVLLIGRIVGESRKAEVLVASFIEKMKSIEQKVQSFKHKPRVYFEEWDHPRITASKWVSELIENVGGVNVFSHKSGSLAKNRIVSDEEVIAANPDIILASWCGKPFKRDKLISRIGYGEINAVANNKVFELESEIFLQPGPALFIDGLDQLFKLFYNQPIS